MTSTATLKVQSHLPANVDDYWARARQPLNCLIFLAPLLILYEVGLLWVGGRHAESLRNGADCWMRGWLADLGTPHPCLLPASVVVGLLVWQVAGKYTWRVSPETLLGMLAESLLFAFCLVVIGQVQDLLFRQCESPAAVACVADSVPARSVPGEHTSSLLVQLRHFPEIDRRRPRDQDQEPGVRDRGANRQEREGRPARPAGRGRTMAIPSGALSRVISFVGAGIYEEVLFRLCLLPACFAAFRLLLLPARPAAMLAVLCTSLAFSLAHYIGPAADQFLLFSFVFRALAGLFFAALFVLRGFGITAGCHAAYDVLVGVLFELPSS